MKTQDLRPVNFPHHDFFCLLRYCHVTKDCSIIFLLLLVFVTAISGCSKKPGEVTIRSPSGSINTSVYADSLGKLMYAVKYKGKTIIAASPLGITIDQQDLGDGIKIGEPVFTVVNETYPSTGVHEMAVDHFREAILPVTHIRSDTKYDLAIKAFDNGIAFRYVIPKTGTAVINGESSSWKIPTGSTVWYQENIFYYEGLYYESTLSGLGSKKVGPPLTYQTTDSVYVSITEAGLYNYSGMSFQSDSNGMLHAAFVNDPQGWKITDTIVTPWRVAMISPDLNGLVNADIIQNLNPAADSSLQKADWIKPGRAVWSYFMHNNVTTMALEKKYIDRAAALGFEYNMVDAGWETSWPNAMDSLTALVKYAKQKKVAIWVWKSYASLNDAAARRHFFQQVQLSGVAGIKIDFIDKEGIEQVHFYEAALREAAAHRLMIDFHGANKPTGQNRTYPNELTREAIYGQEWTTYNPQGPSHNAITPFTRFLAGPADATPGVFDSKKAYGTSRAHQLALQIIFNSALSCWPADPDAYLASAALPLIKTVSTVWDETIVLPPSSIGKVVAFARRKGQNWFIGVINAGGEKRLKLPLTFLGKGNFIASIYQDDLTNSDQLLYSETAQGSGDSLLVTMRQFGGCAVMLKKSADKVSRLTISPSGDYLQAPVEILIKTDPGYAIRFTKDGTAPTAQSTLYEKPFTINGPALIHAKAFNNGAPVEASAIAQFLYSPAPVLSVTGGIFINTQAIRISAREQQGDIRYTLDGSVPTIHSPVYKDSLLVKKSTTVKATIFFKTGMTSVTTAATYLKQAPAPAVDAQAAPGLIATLFEGKWTKLPDFKKLTGGKTSVVNIPDLDLVQSPKEYYAVQFVGYLKIPATGVYSFYVLSDDGSQLFIDKEQVVDNNGSHGDLEKSGTKALAAGLHKFRLNYFQNGSGQTLTVYISGPGIKKELVTASHFLH